MTINTIGQIAYLDQLNRWTIADALNARKRATRAPALKSIVSKAFVAFAVSGALKALDTPGNPFTVEGSQ